MRSILNYFSTAKNTKKEQANQPVLNEKFQSYEFFRSYNASVLPYCESMEIDTPAQQGQNNQR